MRYDFGPLEALVRVQLEPGRNGSDRAFAALLCVDRKQVLRWREYGLTMDQAERCALKAGYVPYEVWPEWLDDVSRPCDDCDERFTPKRKDGRFCSPRCYKRWWDRHSSRAARRAPEAAERNRERRRAYYAENGEYERARERRRYQARRESMVA